MGGREHVESATTKVRQAEQTVEDDDDDEEEEEEKDEHLVMNRQSKVNNTIKVHTEKLSSKNPTPIPVMIRRGRPAAAKIPSSEAEEEEFEEKDEEEEVTQGEGEKINEHEDVEEEEAPAERYSKEKPNGKVKSVDLGKAKVVPEERKGRQTKLAEEDEVEHEEQMQGRPKGKGARRTGAVKKAIVYVKNQADDTDGEEEEEEEEEDERERGEVLCDFLDSPFFFFRLHIA